MKPVSIFFDRIVFDEAQDCAKPGVVETQWESNSLLSARLACLQLQFARRFFFTNLSLLMAQIQEYEASIDNRAH